MRDQEGNKGKKVKGKGSKGEKKERGMDRNIEWNIDIYRKKKIVTKRWNKSK